jgi:hypothetical protein
MADEDPSESSPAAENFSSPKKETVRITLPPQPEDTPMIKRETVRIPTPGVVPKKETTSIGAPTPLPAVSAPEPPPPSATRPLVPPPAPPPRPPAAPGVPSMGSRPAVPPVVPKPAVPTAPKAAYEAKPVTMKAAPKKETARIQVSPTQKLPPQATVRLSQPSGQLTSGPAPAIRTAAPPAATEVVTGEDTIALALSWAALAFSLVAAVFGYMAWSA